LHAYRRSLAERFDYDDARIIAYVDSLPMPPGLQIIDIPARKKRPTHKTS
jgi:hypothetical protein